MEIWHEYGQTFTTFAPEEQPYPDEWEPVPPGTDDKGRLNPQALKHREELVPTKEFLHHSYAEHHILEGPSPRFDGSVPKFQGCVDSHRTTQFCANTLRRGGVYSPTSQR